MEGTREAFVKGRMSEGSFDDIFNRKGEDHSEATVENTPEAKTEEVAAEEAKTEEAPKEDAEAEVKTEAEEKPEEQPRDEKGRFAQREQTVPLSALLAERQRAQAAAQERAEMEQRLREYETRLSQTNRPDPVYDPDGYEQYLQTQVARQVEAKLHAEWEAERARQAATEAQNLFANFATTVVQHDPDEAQAALDYAVRRAEVDDAWGQEGLRQADPVAWFIEQRNRQAQEEAEFAEWRAQRAAAQQQPGVSPAGTAQVAPATQTQVATAAAPRSLASASGATSAPPIALTSSEAFDAIFNAKR